MLICDPGMFIKFESAYGIINKLCYLNVCNAIELGSLRNYIGINFNPDLFCESDSYNLWTSLFMRLDESIINNIKHDVHDILGPFKNNLMFFKEYLYSSEFKYCPDCMKKGYHSIFHQLSFLDNCIFHNIPLEKNCPYCGNKLQDNYININQKAYTCPHCNRKLYERPVENFIIEDIFNKPLNTNIILPKKNELDGYICVLNGKALTNEVKGFLYHYLMKGELLNQPEIVVEKENADNVPFKYYWRHDLFTSTIPKVLADIKNNIDLEEIRVAYRFINEIKISKQNYNLSTYTECNSSALAFILLDELCSQYKYNHLYFHNNLLDALKKIEIALKNQINPLTLNSNTYKVILMQLLEYYLRCCFEGFRLKFEASSTPEEFFIYKIGNQSLLISEDICPNVTFIILQNESEYQIYLFSN